MNHVGDDMQAEDETKFQDAEHPIGFVPLFVHISPVVDRAIRERVASDDPRPAKVTEAEVKAYRASHTDQETMEWLAAQRRRPGKRVTKRFVVEEALRRYLELPTE